MKQGPEVRPVDNQWISPDGTDPPARAYPLCTPPYPGETAMATQPDPAPEGVPPPDRIDPKSPPATPTPPQPHYAPARPPPAPLPAATPNTAGAATSRTLRIDLRG